jgi:hypothetical protein
MDFSSWPSRARWSGWALGFGVVVGAILITINHGDAILRGEVNSTRLWKMALTVCVPYCVSTISSVQAMRTFALGVEKSGPED